MTEPPANYLDPAVLSRITRLEARARQVVEGFISGLHKSPYHGYSVEFAEHREYVPGDEIKHLDWKVWARSERYYIKQYEEETNLQCTLMLDCSKSMRYGEHEPGRMSKFDYGATVAACLAFTMQRQQDAVGLTLFDNDIRLELPPRSHPQQVRRVVHELEQAEPDHRGDVDDVFGLLISKARRRSLVAIVSDLFFDEATLSRALKQFRSRNIEVVLFHVLHHHEIEFPFQGNVLFKGLEMDAELMTEPRALRKAYLQEIEQFLHRTRVACSTAGVDYVQLDTSRHLDAALSQYLATRQRVGQGARR